MTNAEINELIFNISFVTHNLMRQAYKKIDPMLKQYGLVRSHALLLTLLLNKELTMSEISEKLQVKNQNITVLADKLEKLELIERIRTPTDRRVSRIRLTPKGNESVLAHRDEFFQSFADSFNPYSEEDQTSFQSAIQTLKQLLSKYEKEK